MPLKWRRLNSRATVEKQIHRSSNWTRGAAANNEENFIVTNNRHLVAIFAKTFEDLWQQYQA